MENMIVQLLEQKIIGNTEAEIFTKHNAKIIDISKVTHTRAGLKVKDLKFCQNPFFNRWSISGKQYEEENDRWVYNYWTKEGRGVFYMDNSPYDLVEIN